MAARINLLPWRVKRRKQREREFYIMLGAAIVLGVLIVIAGITFYNNRIDDRSPATATCARRSPSSRSRSARSSGSRSGAGS